MADLDRAAAELMLRAVAKQQAEVGNKWQAEGITAAIDALVAGVPEGLKIHRIPAQAGLDPITVYAEDKGNGRGSLTVRCFAEAWTCYWGGMGDTLHGFIASVDPQYLADNMLRLTQPIGGRKKARDDYHAYVERIAAAVIECFQKAVANG